MQLWRSKISAPSITTPQSIYAHGCPSRKRMTPGEVVNIIIFGRIHCNLETIVNSPQLSRGFFQFEFSRKTLLSLPVCCVEIFNYHPITKISSRLWCEVDGPINRVKKSPPHYHHGTSTQGGLFACKLGCFSTSWWRLLCHQKNKMKVSQIGFTL